MDTMGTGGSATILNKVIATATGTKEAEGVQAGELIAVGTKLLKNDFNNFVNALSQVMSYSIFKTERPYKRKFNRMIRTSDRWGNHVRKVGMVSRELMNDGQFSNDEWSDNNMYNMAPVDQVIQTNYYGKRHFEIAWKQYRNQLDTALRSIGEFNTYYAMQMQTVNNDWEQAIENYNRLALINLIVGVLTNPGPMQAVNLLKEYNDLNGTSFTKADVMKKENYTDFVRFSYGFIKTYMKYMRDRTVNFHTQFEQDGKIIDFRRSTPEEYLNLYILTAQYEQINARVLSETFNPEYINSDLFEEVNFWEDMRNPDIIISGGAYLTNDQTQAKAAPGSIESKSIFAVLFDDEAIGVNIFDEWVGASPFEAHRGFINSYWHAQVRYWNSFEDNACVFYLEDE